MKAINERVAETPHSSFNVEYNKVSHFDSTWHYHNVYELIMIVKGTGNLYIGDRVRRFEDNTVSFIGPSLPHLWQNDNEYYQRKGYIAKSIVIKFKEDFLGHTFLEIPESKGLKQLFAKCKTGLIYHGKTQKKLTRLFKQVPQKNGFEQLLLVLRILNQMARSIEYTHCASNEFSLQTQFGEENRIDRVIQHILKNYHRPIKLSSLAEIASLSPPAFCRFFKQQTHKTVFTYITDVRIGFACKLLVENNQPLHSIIEKTGFHNQSNFYRQFKKHTGKTPKQYMEHYWQELRHSKT